MTADEAATFLAAGHTPPEYAQDSGQVVIDGGRWLIGFVQGALSNLAKSEAA
jgi:hypothetical protein